MLPVGPCRCCWGGLALLQPEEEEEFYELRPANKTDHLLAVDAISRVYLGFKMCRLLTSASQSS